LLTDAYMNHGRWVADCPEECSFSALAKIATPYIDCPEHGRHSAIFPIGREEIEAELNKRPVDKVLGAKHANWRPGETLADLRAENEAHGIGV